jgi:hypothetical protein
MARGRVLEKGDETLEDFKQFLDELRIASGCDHGIDAVSELHKTYPALVVHRHAADALQSRGPGVVKRHLDVVAGKKLAVIRNRQLQLNPSPEESTSSRSEPPLDS